MISHRHPTTPRQRRPATVSTWSPLVTLLAAAGLAFGLTGCVPESPAVPAPGTDPGAPAPTPAPTQTPEPPPPVVLNEVAPGISTTPDNQIVVELGSEYATVPNLFDLDGRTLVFTPDGNGGYSRSVGPLVWEDDVGDPVPDGAEVQFPDFRFHFGGRSWDSFFVSQDGMVTFGERLKSDRAKYCYATILQIAADFTTVPAISTMHRILVPDGLIAARVNSRPGRVVVTWNVTDTYARSSTERSHIQLVIWADGKISFSYDNIAWRDGIVGLFPHVDGVRGNLIASVVDETDLEIPGHLDLLDVAIYESNINPYDVIVEFTLRDDVPSPAVGEIYEYRLHFDTDEPFWSEPIDWSDRDFSWSRSVYFDSIVGIGDGVLPLRPSAGNRMPVRVTLPDGKPELSAMVLAEAWSRRSDNKWARHDITRTEFVEIRSDSSSSVVDLSGAGGRGAGGQSEMFFYRKASLDSIVCRVIEVLGDKFDLFVFHGESRFDTQAPGNSWARSRNHVEGIGLPMIDNTSCASNRLKGFWLQPIWMQSRKVWGLDGFDTFLFAHEFTHTWTADVSYLSNGAREPLFNRNHHWREDIFLSAAFPSHENKHLTVMVGGGGAAGWRENADGTFTPSLHSRANTRHSWLDLYLMGLAEASEVPDAFILRNLQPVNASEPFGPHTADKEVVTIEQIVAAEGPRVPSAADSQKDFNAAFVYLVEPGETPDPAMLHLHRQYRDAVLEHWSESTGGRSRITTHLPGVSNHPR